MQFKLDRRVHYSKTMLIATPIIVLGYQLLCVRFC